MQTSSSRRERITKTIILSGVSAAALLSIVAFVGFRAFAIPSSSMANTLMRGDRVLVERIGVLLGRPLYRGEIVVHRGPLDLNQDYVKRIVGVPGDRLKLRDKRLYRNGVEVNEPYVQHSSSMMDSYRDNFPSTPNFPLPEAATEMLEKHVVNGELVIPEGRYFVMGDNRDDAADSRYVGFIRASDVLGRPILIYGSDDPKRIFKRLR